MTNKTNSIKKPSLKELVGLINHKALSALHKELIANFEWTPNKKIRIRYTNGTTEHFGSYYECFETLNYKYRLQLPSFYDDSISQRTDDGYSEPEQLKSNDRQIQRIITILKKSLDKIEKSKKTLHLNMAEIKQALLFVKREITTCDPYDLNTALNDLFKQAYLHDKDMLIYYETIKKEIELLKQM